MPKSETKQKIDKIIDQLSKDGLLENLPGNCVLASELIQNLLEIEGIRSRTVEVTLGINKLEADGGHAFTMVGYNFRPDFQPQGNKVDTHVVVVTQETEPFLIDASIGHYLRHPGQVIVAPVGSINDEVLCSTKAGTIDLIYRIKKNIRLPSIHQKDLVQKLKTEAEMKNKVDFLWKVTLGVILFSVANFALNSALVILKLLYP